MKRLVATIAVSLALGSGLLASATSASAAPKHPIPTGTLRCSSFVKQHPSGPDYILVDLCNANRGNTGLPAHKWFYAGNVSTSVIKPLRKTYHGCWVLPGSGVAYLARCQGADFEVLI